MAILVDVSLDSITGTDSVGLSMAYQKTAGVDTAVVTDGVVVDATYNVKPQDTVSITDAVTPGFVRWSSPSDSVGMTDSLSIAVSYNITNLDTVAVTDVIHTWKPSDSILQTSLEGGSNLTAVLIKRNNTTPAAGVVPPKSVVLPKQPVQLLEYNVINSDPPRRN